MIASGLMLNACAVSDFINPRPTNPNSVDEVVNFYAGPKQESKESGFSRFVNAYIGTAADYVRNIANSGKSNVYNGTSGANWNSKPKDSKVAGYSPNLKEQAIADPEPALAFKD